MGLHVYPNIEKYNPDATYIRKLITQTGMTQAQVAKELGISERSLRLYIARPSAGNKYDIPYCVQYTLEMLAGGR